MNLTSPTGSGSDDILSPLSVTDFISMQDVGQVNPPSCRQSDASAAGAKKPKQLSTRSSSDTRQKKTKKKKDYTNVNVESILKGVESLDFSSNINSSATTTKADNIEGDDIDQVMQERGAQALVSSLLQKANSTKDLQNSQVMERLQLLSQMQQQSRRHLDASNRDKDMEEEEKKVANKPKTAKRVSSDESAKKKKTRDTSPRRHTSPARARPKEAETRKKRASLSPRRESAPINKGGSADKIKKKTNTKEEERNGMDASSSSTAARRRQGSSKQLSSRRSKGDADNKCMDTSSSKGTPSRRSRHGAKKTIDESQATNNAGGEEQDLNGMDASAKSSSSSAAARRSTSTTRKGSKQHRRSSSTGNLTRRSGHSKKTLGTSKQYQKDIIEGDSKCMDSSNQSSSSIRRSQSSSSLKRSGHGKKAMDGSRRRKTKCGDGSDTNMDSSTAKRPSRHAEKSSLDDSRGSHQSDTQKEETTCTKSSLAKWSSLGETALNNNGSSHPNGTNKVGDTTMDSSTKSSLARWSQHGEQALEGSNNHQKDNTGIEKSMDSSLKRSSSHGKKSLDGSRRRQNDTTSGSMDSSLQSSSMRSSSHGKKSLDGSRRRQTKAGEKSMDGSRRRQIEAKGADRRSPMDSSAPASSTRRSRVKTGTETMEGKRQRRRSTSLGPVAKLSQAKDMLYKKNSDHGPISSKLMKASPTTAPSPHVELDSSGRAATVNTQPAISSSLRRSQVDLYAEPIKQRSSEPNTTVASAAAAATAACLGNKPSGKPRRVTMMPTKAFDQHVSEKSKARRRREGSVMERRMRGKDIKEQKQNRKSRFGLTVPPSLQEEEEDAPLADESCHSNASTALSKLSPRRRRGRESVIPGRGRNRRMSLSLEPPATRYPADALLPGLLPMRRQSSLGSFAADDLSIGRDDDNNNAGDQGYNNDESEQVTDRRMTSLGLKERLKQLATFSNSTSSAYKVMDDSSVAQSCGPSVVVPFAEQIPKDILKVHREKQKEMYGALDDSFTDFEFDGGFADLYDDDSSHLGFNGLNIGEDRGGSSNPFS